MSKKDLQLLTLRLPRSLHSELKNLSEIEGTTLNQFCLYLLSKGIGEILQEQKEEDKKALAQKREVVLYLSEKLVDKLEEIREQLNEEHVPEENLSFEEFLEYCLKEITLLHKYDKDFYNTIDDFPPLDWDSMLVKRLFENTVILVLLKKIDRERFNKIQNNVDEIIGRDKINYLVSEVKEIINYNFEDEDLD